MAWIDDRIWCHPKFTGLSARGFRAYVHGLAYAAGMSTRGELTGDQQRIIGASSATKKELVANRLWDERIDGTVAIHDWDEHNGKRDERRASDRNRKRLARAKERASEQAASAGQSADSPVDVPQDSPQDTNGTVHRTRRGQSSGPARVEGSEGSEGSDKDQEPSILPTSQGTSEEGRPDDDELEQLAELARLAAPKDIPW